MILKSASQNGGVMNDKRIIFIAVIWGTVGFVCTYLGTPLIGTLILCLMGNAICGTLLRVRNDL